MHGRSMNSSAAGMMPAAMIAATVSPAARTVSNAISSVRDAGARGRMRKVASVPPPNSPPAQKSEAGIAPPVAAETQALPVHQHQLDAHQVLRRQPVFQAMDAAGIFRDIAADRAGDLARGVGGGK